MFHSQPRQLRLFGKKNQRGVKPPAPLEFALHCMIADSLRRWAAPNWVWTHIPLGERRDDIAGARLKRLGTQPGWPDLIFLPPREHSVPQAHFLELKRPGGKLTEHQAGFALWCKLNGYPFAVADTYDAAVAVLKQWGALMDRVKPQ